MFEDLYDGLGVVAAQNLEYDAARGELRYTVASGPSRGDEALLSIHPADRPLLAASAGRERAVLDLRATPALGEAGIYRLVLRRRSLGGERWASGLVQRLQDDVRAVSPRAFPDVDATGRDTRTLALAHELRQPLFTIAMANENLRLLAEDPSSPRDRLTQAMDRIAGQVSRAQTIISRTLDPAASLPQERAVADFAQAAESAADFLDALLTGSRIVVVMEAPRAPLLVGLAPTEAEQIFVNLLHNAAQSIAERRQQGWSGEGVITVAMAAGPVIDPADGRALPGLRCRVSDNGAGVREDVRAHAHEPFVTGRPHNGTGLGLYVCDRLLDRIGGAIRLKPGQEEGAQVEIIAPLAAG